MSYNRQYGKFVFENTDEDPFKKKMQFLWHPLRKMNRSWLNKVFYDLLQQMTYNVIHIELILQHGKHLPKNASLTGVIQTRTYIPK